MKDLSGFNATKPTDLTALIVCRVSDKSQLKGSGLDSQEYRCRQHADAKGYPVEEVFYAAKSGGLPLFERNEIQQLLAHIDANANSGKRYIVYFDDHKRFAREAEYHMQLRRVLGEKGVLVDFLNFTPEDSPEGKFMELVFAGQAQLEREQNARQSRQKSIARLEQGYWIFRAPVGYRYEQATGGGKVLVIDDVLGPIVKEGLEGFATGRFNSQTELRRFLESRPEYPKDMADGQIRPQTIVRLLGKEIYAGLISCDKWGVSVREGKHEGLISIETYERNQQRMREGVYAPARKDIKEGFPLRGAVCCASCNKPLTAGWSTGKYKKYPYYFCRTKNCSMSGMIPRQKIETEFEELLNGIQPSRTVFEISRAMFKNCWEQFRRDTADSIKAVHAEMSAVEKQIGGLVDRIVEATNPRVAKAFEKRIDELDRKQLVLREKAANFGQPAYPFDQMFELSMRFLSSPCNLWKTGRFDLRRMVLKLTFSGHIPYCKEKGFLNTKKSFPFRALESFCGHDCEMVRAERIELSLPKETGF